MYRLIVLVAIVGYVAAATVKSGPDGEAAILRQSSDVNPDGSYQWSFEADNGISAEESGSLSNAKEPSVQAQGQFEYIAPDGSPISVKYVADENGFQPEGAHFPVAPTPPPIPVYILRALEWNAAHPQEEK